VLPSCCGWTPEGAILPSLRRAGLLWWGQRRALLPSLQSFQPSTPLDRRCVREQLSREHRLDEEGTDGYILPTLAQGAVPLYRLFLNAQGGLHLWTIDVNERNYLVQNAGWVDEGIAGYVIPLP
jgi:hypothetical protein